MGFQVGFKSNGLMLVRKSAVPFQVPRFVLSGMGASTFVVLLQAALQVRTVANIGLARILGTSQDVRVVHKRVRRFRIIALT